MLIKTGDIVEVRTGNDRGTRAKVLAVKAAKVVEAGATAGPGLNPHREAMAHQLTYGIGRQRHPLLITFDLPRYADACDRGCRGGHGAGHGRFSSLAPLPVKSQG